MKTKSFIYIITAGILWGTSGLFVNALKGYGYSSLQMTAMRGLVSFICMLGYVLIKDRGLLKIKPFDLLFFLGNGVALFLTAFLYYTNIQLTSVATAVVIMYTMPIIVMIYSVIFFKEKITALKIIATITMLVGCGLVSGIVGGFKMNPLGLFIGILSGFTYSAYSILTKIEFKRGADPITTSLYSFGFMSVVALSVCEPLKIVERTTSVKAFILLIGLGVVTFVIPYFLYTLSLKYLPAGTASSLSIIEPMAAAVFAVIFLEQVPDLLTGSGIALIIFAVFLLGIAESMLEKKSK